MNFLKYDEKVAIKVAREEAREKGIIEGMMKGKKEGQTYVLELMAQGLSYEQIKKKIEKTSKNNGRRGL